MKPRTAISTNILKISQRNDARKIFYLLSIAIAFQMASCVKKIDANSIYVGTWIAVDGCDEILDISAQSTVTYVIKGNGRPCDNAVGTTSGSFLASEKKIKILGKNYKIIKPAVPLDSVAVRVGAGSVKGLARMTVKKPILSDGNEVEFVKIKN